MKIKFAAIAFLSLLLTSGHGMDKNIHEFDQKDWWGYRIKGRVIENAADLQHGVVRLRLEGNYGLVKDNVLKGEIRSPKTYLFCRQQEEENILSTLTIYTNELYVNDALSEIKKSDFGVELPNPLYFCASINSISFEEFLKREPFKAELVFTTEDLWQSQKKIIKMLNNNYSELEHVVVEFKSVMIHRWKFPKEINVLLLGSSLSIWAVSFGGEDRTGYDNGGVQYVYSFEEEQEKFDRLFKAYEKYHYLSKVKPDKHKLEFHDTGLCMHSINYHHKDPYFSLSCKIDNYEKIIMKLYTHRK